MAHQACHKIILLICFFSISFVSAKADQVLDLIRTYPNINNATQAQAFFNLIGEHARTTPLTLAQSQALLNAVNTHAVTSNLPGRGGVICLVIDNTRGGVNPPEIQPIILTEAQRRGFLAGNYPSGTTRRFIINAPGHSILISNSSVPTLITQNPNNLQPMRLTSPQTPHGNPVTVHASGPANASSRFNISINNSSPSSQTFLATPPVVVSNTSPGTQSPQATQTIPAAVCRPVGLVQSSGMGLGMSARAHMGAAYGRILADVFRGQNPFDLTTTPAAISNYNQQSIQNVTSNLYGSDREIRVNLSNIGITALLGTRTNTALAALQRGPEVRNAYSGRVIELLDLFDPKKYEGAVQLPAGIGLFDPGASARSEAAQLVERGHARRNQFVMLETIRLGAHGSRFNFNEFFHEWQRSVQPSGNALQFVDWLQNNHPVVLAYLAANPSLASRFVSVIRSTTPVAQLEEKLRASLLLFASQNDEALWNIGTRDQILQKYNEARDRTPSFAPNEGNRRMDQNTRLWENSDIGKRWLAMKVQISRELFEQINSRMQWGLLPPQNALETLVRTVEENTADFRSFDCSPAANTSPSRVDLLQRHFQSNSENSSSTARTPVHE